MKMVLALAAAFAFSVSAAAAGCDGHDVTASVDKQTTVASIGTTAAPATVKKEKEAK
jgi:hypothetical protein